MSRYEYGAYDSPPAPRGPGAIGYGERGVYRDESGLRWEDSDSSDDEDSGGDVRMTEVQMSEDTSCVCRSYCHFCGIVDVVRVLRSRPSDFR